ncbi:MAG: DUF1559 domain-containing protein [Pirellulaceae bacterium]|nr:DUF1559 domain-containing protein [Pirellulaceae bacterium]
MSRRQSLTSSMRRRIFSLQKLEDRRLLAATTPDVVELINSSGRNIYSGGFEQRSIIAPVYFTDSLGNRAIDLRNDVPGNQTVVFPSIGVDDDGPFSKERSGRVVRILLDPREEYLITSGGSKSAETWSIPVSAFNEGGELLERLVIPLEYDPAQKVSGIARGYIGDVNWFSSPSLKLPPQTASIVALQGAITSIGFLGDEFEGALQTVRWGDEPLLISKQPVDFIEADDPIAIDPAKVYTLEVNLSSTATGAAKHSVGYTAYDRDGRLIESEHVARYLNAADTTLARELRTGDTFIELADASGWSNYSSDPATRSLAWYGYQDSSGQTYASYSYTRNVATDPGLGLWAAGAVVGNRITLLKPWAGPTLPSGLAVRNAVDGGPLFAVLAEDQLAPLRQSREIVGTWRSGTQNPAAFPPGTAVIRPAVELNQALTISGKTELTYRVATNKSPSLVGSAARIVTIDALANDTGVGTSPRILQVTAPKFGTVEIVSGTAGRPVLRYTAIPYFVGTDRFSYTVAGDNGNTFTEQVSVNSLGSNLESNTALSQRIANYPGILSPDIIAHFSLANSKFEVLQGAELVVNSSLGPRIAEDLGDGSMPVFVSLLAGPSHGSIHLEPDGAFRYIAEPNYTGDVQFLVKISNGTQSLDIPMGIAVRGTAAEVDQNKLGKIGFAEENYYSSRQQYFYPMVPGQPRLSWRVHVLPFLGYSKLYSQFRLDEPWDSANNLPLAAQMPDIYRSTGDAAGNLTRFQTILGAQTTSPTKHWMTANETPRARRGNATHGEGNAILVLQTAPQHAVIWTKPDDLVFTDAQSTLAKLTAPLFPAYFWFSSSGSPSSALLVPRDISANQFQSIATIGESPGVVGVDVASLARGWAERPDTPATLEQFAVPKTNFNIRVISRALANFESTFKVFPQATLGTNPIERTPVSWRVQILPYIGQSELYNRYKLNEPWDSPANLALMNEMPDVFRSASDSATLTTTRIRFLDGTDTAHDRTRTRLRQADFRDGLSNTLLFVEAGVDRAVPWTQPEALPIDMANIWASLGTFPEGFMRIGMADGYGGMLGTGASNADLSALLTTGLARLTTRPREELYDGMTLIRRSGMTVAIDTVNALRWIGQGAYSFENAFRRFPSNIFTSNAPAPLLSWRVAILPFIEADRLYQQFRLNEPWDSPHNLSLLEYMPSWLRSIGDANNTTTTRFQSFVGASSFVNSTGKQVRTRDLLKGSSNTLAYVQTGLDKSVPWTKPSDVNGDAVDIWKELGQIGKTAQFAMADSGVQILTRDGTAWDNLNNAASIEHELTRTIIAANTLVIREGDFAKVELIHQALDEVFEMEPQSFLTMTPRMTFAAAENNTLDGTRKVQLRWGKRSNPADPLSPLIVSQTLDVYVVDNESLALVATPTQVTENGSQVQFTVTRGTLDTNLPLTVSISTDSPSRIQVPSTVVIPSGQMQAAFTGVTLNNSRTEGPVAIRIAASASRHLDSVATVTVIDDDSLRVTLVPSTIREANGSASGIVSRMFGSFAAPLTVNLSTSNSSIAQVDSQVTIPAGRNSASFVINAVSDASYDGVQLVSIIADANLYGRAEGRLTVNDFEPLSVRFQSTSISERGGVALVTVNRGAAGLEQPLLVQLQSSDTSELIVPASLIIPAGQRSATFTATAVDDRLLDGVQVISITASSDIADSGNASIQVQDYEELSLAFEEAQISENGGINRGRITRSNVDIDQPLVVSLSSNPSNPALQLPSTVIIPAGANLVDFEVRVLDDTLLNFTRTFAIHAESPGYVGSTADFEVTDEERLRLTIDRRTVSERSDSTTARITRLNTNIDQAISINLTSIDAHTRLEFPTSIVIPAGSAHIDFVIDSIDNRNLSGTRKFSITAENEHYLASSAEIEVTDYEELIFQFDQTSAPENGFARALLMRSDTEDLSQPLTVQLRANFAGVIELPDSIIIPADSPGINFSMPIIDNNLLAAGPTVIVEAMHPGYITGRDEIRIDDFETLSVEFDRTQISEAGQTLGRVVRSNTNIDQALTVSLQTTTSGVVRTPASVTIPVGSTFATFTIDGLDNNILEETRTVDIQAVHPAYYSIPNTIEVSDYEPLELILSTAQQWEGSSITATATRNVDDLSQAVTVSISISDRTQVTAPDFVVIPAGQRSVNFELGLSRDRLRDGNNSVALDIQAAGFVPASKAFDALDLESLWHNPRSSLDVNDDGLVSPLDALLVINFLNTARGPIAELVRPQLTPLFLDTSNDGNLSPLDALLVINHLNRRASGEGEMSESRAADAVVDLALGQLDEELRRRLSGALHSHM